MYFLRWLAKNPILSMLLGVVLFAVFNWGSLDSWFGKEKEHQPKVAEVQQVSDHHVVADASNTTVSGQEAAASAPAEVAEAITDNIVADATTDAAVSVEAMAEDVAEKAVENDDHSVFSRLFKRKETTETVVESQAQQAASDKKSSEPVAPEQPLEAVPAAEVVVEAVPEPILFKQMFPTLDSNTGAGVADVATETEEVVIQQLDAGTVIVNDVTNAAPIPDPFHDNQVTQLQYTLESARAAFWKKDMTTSNAIYQQLLQADPDNTDLLGEYGNMLFQTGNIENAVDIYAKTAGLLINENRIEDAKPLIVFIAKIDHHKAEQLLVQIHENSSR